MKLLFVETDGAVHHVFGSFNIAHGAIKITSTIILIACLFLKNIIVSFLSLCYYDILYSLLYLITCLTAMNLLSNPFSLFYDEIQIFVAFWHWVICLLCAYIVNNDRIVDFFPNYLVRCLGQWGTIRKRRN